MKSSVSGFLLLPYILILTVVVLACGVVKFSVAVVTPDRTVAAKPTATGQLPILKYSATTNVIVIGLRLVRQPYPHA